MSDVDISDPAVAPATMLLVLRNVRPISSAEFGELFTALARDYARVTRGRTLIVAEVRAGSIYATLTDLATVAGPFIKDGVEIAKAVKGMIDFGRTIRSVLDRAKDGGGGVFSGNRKRNGEGSAEALLKIAADADAEVEIEHTTPDGYAIRIKLNPVEAIRIRERAATQRLRLQAERQSALPKASDFEFDADTLTQSLLSLPGSTGGPSEETRAAVAALVGALRGSGFGFVLAQVAQALEARGRPDLAQLLLDRDASF